MKNIILPYTLTIFLLQFGCQSAPKRAEPTSSQPTSCTNAHSLKSLQRGIHRVCNHLNRPVTEIVQLKNGLWQVRRWNQRGDLIAYGLFRMKKQGYRNNSQQDQHVLYTIKSQHFGIKWEEIKRRIKQRYQIDLLQHGTLTLIGQDSKVQFLENGRKIEQKRTKKD